MKKFGIGIIVSLILVVSIAGTVFAQAGTPADPPDHPRPLERIAELLDMTVENIQEALDNYSSGLNSPPARTIQELADNGSWC